MELRFYGHDDASGIRDLLLDVHDEIYQGEKGSFDSRETFAGFVDRWSSRDTWACVISYDQEQPVGYAYGAMFSPGGWWSGATRPELDDDAKVFALSELMVRDQWRGTGESVRLHDALIENQRPDVLTLFVDSSHPKVQALYESWGYRELEKSKPYEDSPVFSVMVKHVAA